MASADVRVPAERRPLDVLELEQIAVGPYCVFDHYNPSDAKGSLDSLPLSPSAQNKATMEDPLITGEFGLPSGLRNGWLPPTADDLALGRQSPDTYAHNNWDNWIRFDPMTQQQFVSPKQFKQPDPAMFVRNGNMPSAPTHNDNLHGRGSSASLDQLQNVSPVDTYATPNSQPIPYTFGEPGSQQPAFSFNGLPTSNALPPSTTGYDNNVIWNPIQAMSHDPNVIFSPISWEQQQQLRDIALPPQSETPSLHQSPTSNTRETSSASPEPPRTSGNSKKRKSSSEEEADSPDAMPSGKQPPVKKTAHNMIEKRYRTNLNDKIAALRDSVPSLRVMSRQHNGNEDEDGEQEDLEGLTPAHKLNKATVLSKATEYIRHLEKRNRRLGDENSNLKLRLSAFEKLAMTGGIAGYGAMNGANTNDPQRYSNEMYGDGSSQNTNMPSGPPQGMIQVPENIRRLRASQSQVHYAAAKQQQASHQPPQQQHQQTAYTMFANGAGRQPVQAPQQQQMMAGGPRNGMMSKLMVGSLAGLMIMEGFSEREQGAETPSGRGLAAIPTQLFGKWVGLQGSGGLPMLKWLLIVGAVVYLLAPLFDFKPQPKKKAPLSVRLTAAPSLASPIEVRRKAWLTAIQTVWVPQHSFVLEAAALLLKTIKLSTRKMIGWQGYALITGMTKEQEDARVKAWEIALDAQLAGGDAEISMSRLVLTLMASGTLPDTPARLMLKAMHIRVLLWEVANAGYGTWFMFEEVAAKLARRYWNAARFEHKLNTNNLVKTDRVAEQLPDHLAVLLDMECDDVLVDPIVQRAYNLAWNRPSAENTESDEAMDAVVEDFAIRSPLDALAAWWSSLVLSKALAMHLDTRDEKTSEDIMEAIDTAARTAPPSSGAQARALVSRLLLSKKDREANITTALNSLPSTTRATFTADLAGSPTTVLMNIMGSTPIANDVRFSLTIAKCLSLMAPQHPQEIRDRGSIVLNSIIMPASSLTLLSFVAAYKLLEASREDDRLLTECSRGLEHLSGSVRVWIGKDAARRSGLSIKSRERIVHECTAVSKALVGIRDRYEEGDDGYVSQSEGEDEKC